MFTDKFIKLPCNLYDRETADIVGYNEKSKDYETILKINPFEISHYRQTVNEDTKELTETLIHFRNGDSTVIALSIEKFEELLNKHQQ